MANRDELDDEFFEKEELPPERGDTLAMWIAGLLMIGIPCVVAILVIIGVALLLFS